MSKWLSTNEHPVERILRVVIGVFLLSLMFWGPRTWFGLIGIVPILTGSIGICPIYSLFGLHTNKPSKPDEEAPSQAV